MPKSTGADWMSTTDACAHLGITLRALYRIIDTGGLPAYKFGRLIRLRTVDVEAFGRLPPGEGEEPT